MAAQDSGRAAILSSDTDFFRVLSPVVTLCRTIRGKRDQVRPADVEERYGVSCRQWADYLALVGKKSNGLSGVPGIGPKGAAELLGEFGDLEAVLERPVRMKAQYRRKLQCHADAARLGKRLSTLVTDLELEP